MQTTSLSHPSNVHSQSLSITTIPSNCTCQGIINDKLVFTIHNAKDTKPFNKEHYSVYPIIEFRRETEDEYGKKDIVFTALVDSCSGTSFITRKAAEQLNLKVIKQHTSQKITGFQGVPIILDEGVLFELVDDYITTLLLVDYITDDIPQIYENLVSDWPFLENRQLSSSFPRNKKTISILLGLPDIKRILSNEPTPIAYHPSLNLFATNSKFGWIVQGESATSNDHPSDFQTLLVTNEDLNETLKPF